MQKLKKDLEDEDLKLNNADIKDTEEGKEFIKNFAKLKRGPDQEEEELDF